LLKTFTIARRELMGLFFSPVAYVVLVVYLLFVGLLFALLVFSPGAVADPGPMFAWNHLALMFVVPFITMALFSEEYRSGRIETLRTSPISDFSIVLGKFLGALAFYCVIIGSSLVYILILSAFGRPDFMPVLTSYFGLVLMGMLMLSIGLFFSACTQHQVLAAISSCAVLVAFGILFQAIGGLLGSIISQPPAWLNTVQRVMTYMSFEPQMQHFSMGLVDTSHVAFFLTGTFFFLMLTYLVLESRKWR